MSKDIEPMEQKTNEVLERICHRIIQISRIDDSINLSNLSIDDTGIDSLELTEMILELEEHFSVIIDDSQLSGSTKISELAAQVAAQLY